MRKLSGIVLGISSFLVAAKPAFAIDVALCPSEASGFNPLCKFQATSFPGMISTAIQLLLILAVVISLFFLIYGGIKWVVSGGDKTAVEGARNHIVAAIIGLSIALLAFFIINIVGGLFGLDLNNLKLPKLTP